MWLTNDNNKIYYIYITYPLFNLSLSLDKDKIYILVFSSFYFKVKVLFDKIYLEFPFMYSLILIEYQNILICFRNK